MVPIGKTLVMMTLGFIYHRTVLTKQSQNGKMENEHITSLGCRHCLCWRYSVFLVCVIWYLWGVEVMTPEERQEIRERHFLWKERECNYDGDPYPCDVIKVLDAWEAELGLVIKSMTHEKFMQELTKAQEQIGLYNEGN